MNRDKLIQMLTLRRTLLVEGEDSMTEVLALGERLELTVPEIFFLFKVMDHRNPFEFDHMTIAEYRANLRIREGYTACHFGPTFGVSELLNLTHLSQRQIIYLFKSLLKYQRSMDDRSLIYNPTEPVLSEQELVDHNLRLQRHIEHAWQKLSTPFQLRIYRKLKGFFR